MNIKFVPVSISDMSEAEVYWLPYYTEGQVSAQCKYG